jgi:4-hydroxy-L-threonine phosphate dehydrogenase PdxA
MERKCIPIVGIILGDHAGIGPEITVMALIRAEKLNYIPVLTGNLQLFRRAMKVVPGSEKLEIVDITANPDIQKQLGKIYFYNVPAGDDIPFGKVTADSGHLIYSSMKAMLDLERREMVDGIVMGPITKQALHAARLCYSSEFDIFSEYFGVKGVRAVVRAGNIYRCSVVGHVRFTEIVDNLTPQSIIETAHALIGVMKRFRHPDDIRIAVAALNPHAGEDGLFGDEETVKIQPAIDMLLKEGVDVVGPCPADTVYYRAQIGKVGGIVYLYHDQGNIAMKAASFGEGVLIYANVPAKIVSVGHGGAFGSAGKGTASPQNIQASICTLLEMIQG